jgi:hypothetical protein
MLALASAHEQRTGDESGRTRLAVAEAESFSVYVDASALPVLRSAGHRGTERWAYASLNVVVPGIAEGLALPTGQETMLVANAAPVRSWFPLVDLAAEPTGYGWMLVPVLCAFVSEGDASDIDETDEPSVCLTMVHTETPDAGAEASPQNTPEAVAAARVRDLSGLEGERLAELLGVSRTAFYDWLRGVKPRGKRRDHLLHVEHIIDEAARRLASAREVAAWLMAPSEVSGRVPFALLKEHQYELARSLLTRTRRPRLPSRARRPLERAELREALDRTTSRPAPEDYEDVPPDE